MFNKKNLYLIPLVVSILCADNEIDGLGDLAGGIFSSHAVGVNTDGTVIVGYSTSASGTEAFRWTQAGGMVGLGDLAGGIFSSLATGVSADGTVVVGRATSASGLEAYRWTQAGGMVGLGDLAGGAFLSYAYGVNTDGTVVVGYSTSALGTEAFRWTQAGGMVGLGDLAGGAFLSVARGVNADGTVVVGYSTSASGNEAFRWTQAGGMVGLGDLAGGIFGSYAMGVNADGTVVVGGSYSASGLEAYRWTQAGGMVGLGDLAGGSFSSYAMGVNADGTVVVGYGTSATGNQAFRWTQSTGMQSLEDWLGISLSGWSDMEAQGVSDDGNTVAGYGTSSNGTEGFIAIGGQGLIGINDFTSSLQSINSSTAQSITNISMLLHGAHGHPGNRRAIDDKRVMWIAGDVSSDNRDSSKDNGYIGEVGVSIKHNDHITYSLAIGNMIGDSKLDYKGTIDNDGKYIVVDTDIKPLKNIPFYSTTTLAYGQNNLTIKRGFDNGGVLTHSTGDTHESFLAFKQKLQYQFEILMPYLQMNHIQVKRDGYSESGGGFPSSYDNIKENVTDYRVGVDANFELNKSNKLISTLEAVHRVQKKGEGISGQVVGLGSFSLDGREYDQNWTRATVGVEHTFENDSRFTLTFNRTSRGEDPLFWSGFNYSISF